MNNDFNATYELEEVAIAPEFPAKPEEKINNQYKILKSIGSLALFIIAFHFFFEWELIYILVLSGILFLHELGHHLSMRFFKYEDLEILFVPLLGALAIGNKQKISQKESVLIYLAGPIPGIIIGTILYYIGWHFFNEFLIRTASLFIYINLFNLLPVLPLDGGQTLKTMFFKNNQVVNVIFLVISTIIVAYFAISLHAFILFMIPFFLIMQYRQQSQIRKARKALLSEGIDINKNFKELSDREYWLIRDAVDEHLSINLYINQKEYKVADNEQKIIPHIKSILDKKYITDLSVKGKLVALLVWVLAFIVPIASIILTRWGLI